jgi:5-methylcytosine-specific restriction endonuclease McrA
VGRGLCKRHYQLDWRRRHSQQMRKYWSEYGQRPEQVAYKKAYWHKNKKRLSRLFKEYSKKNQHIIRRAGYRYFRRHKHIVHERNKAYRQTHMDKVLYWIRRRKVAHLKAKGSHTLRQWTKLRRKTGGICPCCKKNVGLERLTPDHIVPLVRGGADYIWNIQPLCKSCNSSKGARHATKY